MSNTPPPIPQQPPVRTPAKSLGMAMLGLVSVIYILNPGAGFIDLIPDNIPGLGNLDEAFFVILLLRVLAYFGVDLKLAPTRSKNKDKIIDV